MTNMTTTPPQRSNPDSGSAYNESNVQVLQDGQHVRARPGMYIGDTQSRGLHHLVYEVVDNSIDEAMAGVCDRIDVVIHAGGSISVADNGRGFPVGIKPEFGMSALELCLTKIGAGAKFDRDSYKVSGGLHGVGVSAVNALSEWLEVRTARDGKLWRMRFARGRTVSPLEVLGEASSTGTRVEFLPDAEIFSRIEFDYGYLAKRLRELSYLNPGLTISIRDERDGREEVFHFPDGLRQYVEHLNEGKTALHPPVSFSHSDPVQRLICSVAFQYNDGYSENILSFANNINTVEGGTHLSGFKAALTRAVNNYARKSNLLKANDPVPTGEDIREGLTAIVSAMVPEPQFEGQTKTKLGNGEVGTFVETVVGDRLATYFEEHPPEAKRIVQKAVQAALAREAARKARETARKSAMSGGGLSRKLVDCASRNVESTELFIVEGDSAAGSAKGHRDAETQAILPIRGKILNVEKARLHKVLNHDEILEIIKALGTGIGAEEFDLSKLRYGKIILMTDADVDGSHIRTLLLTFFFRQMRPLIDHGHVYIAQPPLYQLQKGKNRQYVLDDPALHARLTQLGLDQTVLHIRRLGEPPRMLQGADLASLLHTLEEIDRQARSLSRRGIQLRPFVQEEYRDGRLPVIRGATREVERYFHDEAAFEAFRQEQEADGRTVVRTELAESRNLLRCFEELTRYGCAPVDLFAHREETVTGELTPAVFVLHNPQAGEIGLDNLNGLVTQIRDLGSRGWEIKRFKGLGEMNKEELWETTMDPANRVLRRVTVGEPDEDPEQAAIDAAEADTMFSILMGEDVERRKEFIDRNAALVKNLDV